MIKLTCIIIALLSYAAVMTWLAVPEIENRIADWGYDHKMQSMHEFQTAEAFIAYANSPNLKDPKDVKRK